MIVGSFPSVIVGHDIFYVKMVEPGTSEYIIQEVVGCGPFQVIITILVFFLGNACSPCTIMFMAFGSYDPGWKCLHLNESSTNISYSKVNVNNTIGANGSDSRANDVSGYHIDSCSVFESCEKVLFNPEASTIVSEWGLVCNHKWIPSIIISIQMAGLAIGCPIAGHLGDAVGRKMTLYAALLAMAVLNFISIFSSSWQMFAVFRFFLGISIGLLVSIYYVFNAEFVTQKWRSVLSSAPAWNISTIIFSLACMYLKDWRHVHIVTALIGLAGFIPVLWVPESLRFLEVKNKNTKFERVARKISKLNGKRLPSLEGLGNPNPITRMKHKEEESLQNTKLHWSDAQQNKKTYNYSHLFKGAYKRLTLMITLPWLAGSLVYYAVSFGVKALHGHFYLNLMISSAIELPFAIIPILLSNHLGRKTGIIILAAGTAACLIGASCFEELSSGDVQSIGVLILISTAKVTVGGFWCILMVYILELYPTVIRGMAYSWGNLAARIGGIIAPFLIPNDPDTVSISYAVMGFICLICCVTMIKLPETKDLPLKETYKPVTFPSLEHTAL